MPRFNADVQKPKPTEAAPMNPTISPTLPASASEKRKPATSKELIAANIQSLIEQLEAGHSEGLTAYLAAMGKFHNYSFLCCA
jgi:hypothetical protein